MRTILFRQSFNALLFLCMTLNASAAIVPTEQSQDTSALKAELTDTSLNTIEGYARSLSKAAKELNGEMNRHAEIATWNGIFGEPNMLYNEYSYYDTEPIGPGLASSYEEGPLLPPRDEVTNKWLPELANTSKLLTAELKGLELPSTASSQSKAQWEVLQNTNSSIQPTLDKLTVMLGQDDYEQLDAAKLTKELLNDANGIDEIRKRLQKLLK